MNLHPNDRIWLAFPLILVGTVVVAAERPLTNADVMALVEAGFSEAVIVAKVEQAADVAFDLETEDLARLKEAHVPDAVLTAMLERATPERQPTAEPVPAVQGFESARVWLRTPGEDLPLALTRGGLTSTSHALAMGLGKSYVTYPGLQAATRISDRQPTLLLEDEIHPRERYWLVRLRVNQKTNDRSVRVNIGGGVWRMRTQNLMKPHEKWRLSYTTTADGDGRWLLTPQENLPPGEYGLYSQRGQAMDHLGLFAFGVE